MTSTRDIDARINDVDNPATWTGFHRIEKALWADKTAAGMAPSRTSSTPTWRSSSRSWRPTKYQPAQLANGATDLLNEVASSKITGEEDRYSHTDLSDFQANIDGASEAFTLLQPALKTIDPQLASTVDARFTDVVASLQPYKGTYAGLRLRRLLDRDRRPAPGADPEGRRSGRAAVPGRR